MDADLFARASDKLRALVETIPDSPWTYEGRVVYDKPDELDDVGPNIAITASQDEAAYITGMQPRVALALANWLDTLKGLPVREDGPLSDDVEHAFRLARAVLGEES